MHCGCMPWCLLNINVLGCGTKLLLGVLRGQNLKKFSNFFPILGWEILFISYFLATVILIFLFPKCHLSLDTLVHFTLKSALTPHRYVSEVPLRSLPSPRILHGHSSLLHLYPCLSRFPNLPLLSRWVCLNSYWLDISLWSAQHALRIFLRDQNV